MRFVNKTRDKSPRVFILLGALLFPVDATWAESDKELQEMALKAREKTRVSAEDHSAHLAMENGAGQFRGVFYGYLPCNEPECNGLKLTLSLNPKNNYLLITQPAKVFNRESFEKGKYEWDAGKGTVLLNPHQGAQRRLAIKDEGSLLYLGVAGTPRPADEDRYLLRRSDKAGNREMHIH